MKDSMKRHNAVMPTVNEVFAQQQAKPPSVSSQVYKYLRNEVPEDTLLTVASICGQLGLPASDHGAVSGFLSRMRKMGVLQYEGIQSGTYAYTLGDISIPVRTKKVRGVGGKPGTHHNGSTRLKAPVLDAPATPATPDIFDFVEQVAELPPEPVVHKTWGEVFDKPPPQFPRKMGKVLADLAHALEEATKFTGEAMLLAHTTTLHNATLDELLAEVKTRAK